LDPAVLAECGQTDGKVGTRNLMPYNKPRWTVSSLDHNEKAQVMMGSIGIQWAQLGIQRASAMNSRQV